MKTLKTWEMLRDIREGETYESVGAPDYFVTMRNGYVRFLDESSANLSYSFMVKEWRKRTPATVTVDFAKAFAAYEKGAQITSLVSGSCARKGTGILPAKFTEVEIRGMWSVDSDAQYWWE